jgi:hypothetical protein
MPQHARTPCGGGAREASLGSPPLRRRWTRMGCPVHEPLGCPGRLVWVGSGPLRCDRTVTAWERGALMARHAFPRVEECPPPAP